MQIEPTWWITAVEAPIVAALFHMLHGLRSCTRLNSLSRLGLCDEAA
jgi:hypothetical protein